MKREDTSMISYHSLGLLLELIGRFYSGKQFLQYQMLDTFHCTYKYYAFVSEVSVIFCHIDTPSNAVIEHPLFYFVMKIAQVCTYHQGGWQRQQNMRQSSRYALSIYTVSAGLTERLNLKLDVKDTTNWYILHWLVAPEQKTHQQVVASFINFYI